jgi:hypothetical protein
VVPRNLNLPQSGTLKTEKVIDGLYVVKGAYSLKSDYFATSRLYSSKDESELTKEVAPTRASD